MKALSWKVLQWCNCGSIIKLTIIFKLRSHMLVTIFIFNMPFGILLHCGITETETKCRILQLSSLVPLFVFQIHTNTWLSKTYITIQTFNSETHKLLTRIYLVHIMPFSRWITVRNPYFPWLVVGSATIFARLSGG